MFGADTPLVMDALQLVAIAATVSAGAVFFTMKRRKPAVSTGPDMQGGRTKLEDRVAVLERIATDQSIGLADEIEALREDADREDTRK